MPSMTAFISRCWKRRSAWLAGLWLAGGLALASLPAWAGSIEPRAAELRAADDGYVLSAEFAIDLGPRLEDAVTRADIFCTATGNADVITAAHMAAMKPMSIVCNIGHFDNEIDVASLAKCKWYRPSQAAA